MFFFPVGCLIFVLFILALPILFILVFFNIVAFSFEKLGISPEIAILLLFLILFGSLINIPISRRKVEYVEVSRFRWFKVPARRASGIAINLGGAIIPFGLSLYLLTKVPLWPVLAATALMIIICKFSSLYSTSVCRLVWYIAGLGICCSLRLYLRGVGHNNWCRPSKPEKSQEAGLRYYLYRRGWCFRWDILGRGCFCYTDGLLQMKAL